MFGAANQLQQACIESAQPPHRRSLLSCALSVALHGSADVHTGHQTQQELRDLYLLPGVSPERAMLDALWAALEAGDPAEIDNAGECVERQLGVYKGQGHNQAAFPVNQVLLLLC